MEKWEVPEKASLALNMCLDALRTTYGQRFKGWIHFKILRYQPGNTVYRASRCDIVPFGGTERIRFVAPTSAGLPIYSIYGMVKWTKSKTEHVECYCLVGADIKGHPIPIESVLFQRPFHHYKYITRRLWWKPWRKTLCMERSHYPACRTKWLQSIGCTIVECEEEDLSTRLINAIPER